MLVYFCTLDTTPNTHLENIFLLLVDPAIIRYLGHTCKKISIRNTSLFKPIEIVHNFDTFANDGKASQL